MHILKHLFRRARSVYRSEGLLSLAKQATAYAAGWLFKYDTYYLYGICLEDDADLRDTTAMPPLDDAACRVVSGNREADDLEAEGLEFRSQVLNAREHLDRGATAFCIFVGQQLAHIVWVAMSQEAKDSLEKEPLFRVDFSGGECWSAGAWTEPRYRRSGLLAYGDIMRRQFLLDHGVHTSLWAINKRNVPPRRFVARLGPQIHREGRCLKVLWWKSWRERPLTAGNDREQRNAND